MLLLLTFKKLNIKTPLKHLNSGNKSNVWQNTNDPDHENEHFKQLHIAIELTAVEFHQNKRKWLSLCVFEQSNQNDAVFVEAISAILNEYLAQ